jgi:hypothetical protein
MACPADALAPTDAASLRGLVTFLAGRGVHTITVAADDSARSAAAAAVVRDTATRSGLAVGEANRDSALVVVSGWAPATASLTELAGRQRTEVIHSAGTYLAPWLLAAPVLRAASGAVLPLRFDPRDEQPVRYDIALRTRFHGATASSAGYHEWLASQGSPEPTVTRLYAVSQIAFLPQEFAMQHGDHDAGWFPGGTVVPVTGEITS